MSSSANDCRVLVVDDDVLVLKAMVNIFSRVGYPVTNTEGAAAAFDLVCRAHYDLVISDFDMPVLDGYQLACCIKQEDPGTKVVVMTGSSQRQVSLYIDRREVDRWLFKPFGLQAISNVMTSLGLPNAFEAHLSKNRTIFREAF